MNRKLQTIRSEIIHKTSKYFSYIFKCKNLHVIFAFRSQCSAKTFSLMLDGYFDSYTLFFFLENEGHAAAKTSILTWLKFHASVMAIRGFFLVLNLNRIWFLGVCNHQGLSLKKKKKVITLSFGSLTCLCCTVRPSLKDLSLMFKISPLLN